jgi:hypothetical protein
MKFFLKIFVILMIFSGFNQIYGNLVVLNNRIKLSFDPLITKTASDSVLEYIEDVNSITNKIFKKKKQVNAIPININFYYNSQKEFNSQNFIVKKDTAEIFLFNLKSINLETNFPFRRELISVVIQSYIGDKNAQKLYQVPYWLAVAIDSRIQHNRQQRNSPFRTRNTIGMKLLVRNNATLNPKIFNNLPENSLNTLETLLIGDFAQLIMDLCMMKNNLVMLEYLTQSYNYQQQNMPDNQLYSSIIIPLLEQQSEKYFISHQQEKSQKDNTPLSPEEKEKNLLKYIKNMAQKYAFHSKSPYPGNIAKSEFDNLCTITIPVLNEKNEATEEFKTFHLSELPKLMRERSDAVSIKKTILKSFYEFANSTPSIIRTETLKVISLLENCKNSLIFGTSTSALKKAIQQLDNKITQQQEFENFLNESSREYLNIYQLYPYEIKIVNEYFDSMGSREIHNFLQETEEKFYGPF